MKVIIKEIARNASIYLKDNFPENFKEEMLKKNDTHGALNDLLSRWAIESPKPIILFIDEIDSLIGDTLISVLRQLRAGYTNRPRSFPQSIVLCGLRDVRDYRIHSSKTKKIITGGSAYNIKAESLRLGDFTREEVEEFLLIHTKKTGQPFAPGVFDLVWEYSYGQPWLVNALAYEVCFKKKENRDRSVTITPDMVKEAAENLIKRRETHLDQLTDKLSEERVKKVIQPILMGEADPENIPDDELQYVIDLGLIRGGGQLEIANKIYKEVIPRTLVFSTQQTISQQTEWYVADSGRLNLPKLLSAFQEFFRKHSESWIQRFNYQEAGPQLLLQAFLQRIVNGWSEAELPARPCVPGGGRVEREYGLGTLRTDILVTWSYEKEKSQTAVIELKIQHNSRASTITQGLKQTTAYMDRCGTNEGYLILFDRNPRKTWDEKIFYETMEYNGKRILIWGM